MMTMMTWIRNHQQKGRSGLRLLQNGGFLQDGPANLSHRREMRMETTKPRKPRMETTYPKSQNQNETMYPKSQNQNEFQLVKEN